MAAEALDPVVRPQRATLTLPLTGSLLLHAALIALFIFLRPGPPPPSPPVYRVDLVAAPPGPRAPGVVKPPEQVTPPPTPKPQPTPVRPRTPVRDVPVPTKKVPPRPKTPEA